MPQISNKAKKVITRPIPDQLVKQRTGGGNKSLSYLSGQTVIDMLNEAFNYMWNWETEKEWIQNSIDKFNPRYDKEPIPQNPVAHVKGKLTVFIEQEKGQVFSLSKTGYGSKSIMGSQSDQESIFKAAATDALKKSASLLGIGLELYRDEEEQAYFLELNFEDPWSEKMLNEFKNERDYIKEFMSSNSLEIKDINKLVSDFSDNNLSEIEDIVPDNIQEFVEYLKNRHSSKK
jgi:recombination DNA repair RAD52 pathway protein